MQTFFEAMGGTYRQDGDYLLPNIEAPESPQIGFWGQRRWQYLRISKKVPTGNNYNCRACKCAAVAVCKAISLRFSGIALA